MWSKDSPEDVCVCVESMFAAGMYVSFELGISRDASNEEAEASGFQTPSPSGGKQVLPTENALLESPEIDIETNEIMKLKYHMNGLFNNQNP